MVASVPVPDSGQFADRAWPAFACQQVAGGRLAEPCRVSTVTSTPAVSSPKSVTVVDHCTATPNSEAMSSRICSVSAFMSRARREIAWAALSSRRRFRRSCPGAPGGRPQETIHDTALVEHLDGAGCIPAARDPFWARSERCSSSSTSIPPRRRVAVARVRPVGPAPAINDRGLGSWARVATSKLQRWFLVSSKVHHHSAIAQTIVLFSCHYAAISDTTRAQRRRAHPHQRLEVLSRDGFHATSIDDIVAATGSRRARFYRYFSGKEESFVRRPKKDSHGCARSSLPSSTATLARIRHETLTFLVAEPHRRPTTPTTI